MTRRALAGFLLLALLGASPLARAHEDAAPPKKLGTVVFANSCAPQAQESFERGVVLLHSFAFAAGEQAFREALDRDPACAIATWGIATSSSATLSPSARARRMRGARSRRSIAAGRSAPRPSASATISRPSPPTTIISASGCHARASSLWRTPSKLWPNATATMTRRKSSAPSTSPPASRLPTRATAGR
jgi:hypothetical protein